MDTITSCWRSSTPTPPPHLPPKYSEEILIQKSAFLHFFVQKASSSLWTLGRLHPILGTAVLWRVSQAHRLLASVGLPAQQPGCLASHPGGWRQTPPRLGCAEASCPRAPSQKPGTQVRLSINTSRQRVLSMRHRVHKRSPLCDVGSWFIHNDRPQCHMVAEAVEWTSSPGAFRNHFYYGGQRACVARSETFTFMIVTTQDEEGFTSLLTF